MRHLTPPNSVPNMAPSVAGDWSALAGDERKPKSASIEAEEKKTRVQPGIIRAGALGANGGARIGLAQSPHLRTFRLPHEILLTKFLT